jgi:hypothetical protein
LTSQGGAIADPELIYEALSGQNSWLDSKGISISDGCRCFYRENDPHEIIGLLGYQFSSSGVKHPFMTI